MVATVRSDGSAKPGGPTVRTDRERAKMVELFGSLVDLNGGPEKAQVEDHGSRLMACLPEA